MGSLETKIQMLSRFNPKPTKRSTLQRLDMVRFQDVKTRRVSPDQIIRVRATKPNRNPMLNIMITRQESQNQSAKPYTEVLHPRELAKLGFTEWEQILSIVSKHKSKAAAEVKIAIETLIDKVRRLGLIPSEDKPKRRSSSSAIASSSRSVNPSKPDPCQLLLPYGTRIINNSLPAGVEPVQHKFIPEPEHGIFYFDGNRMCFQRSADLQKAPTEHLLNLRLACMDFPNLEKGFHYLISNELITRREELKIGVFGWTKPEIEAEVTKFYDFMYQQSV